MVIPEGDILTMLENFLLAEQVEKEMSEEKENGKSNAEPFNVSKCM